MVAKVTWRKIKTGRDGNFAILHLLLLFFFVGKVREK
jgi:hypothetical protein